MTTAPLLYVCVRPQQGAAAAEYESFRTAMKLDESAVGHLDLVREPLTDDILERYSGFLVGGSPFNLADPESTKTDVQRRVEAGLERIASHVAAGSSPGSEGPAAMFTCYGIGVVTRMLGGEVSRAYPEDTGPVGIELTADGRTDPLFGGLAARFTALTAHKEGTASAPPGATLLAVNEGCPVQAYVVGDRLYATQFHPEPTTKAFTERMAVYRDDGYFESDHYEVVAGRVLAASVTEPARLLQAFARRFGPAAA
ncbi:glutamine amidotransferase-related protein [Microbacterium sp. CFBP9034]|uniref:glutamine amidotransferase-related protein n=1 Tax=Microbacterium sp. CFBP9034 TaxID=3096540 RepID=UPI002A6ABD57|nr:GMP synthase [Microbacterium sp. CFBP9034]MDY0910250.1 GMP synthase [Microbacterium sp. CFBP9034]